MTSGCSMSRSWSRCSIGQTAPRSGESWSNTRTLTPTCVAAMRPGRARFPSVSTGQDSRQVFEPEELGQRKDELATAMREARKQAGLTGERLAARCGISQSKISKIETGKVLPSATDVERILTALGLGGEHTAEVIALARLANTEFQSVRASLQR